MRVFVGLPLPEGVISALERVQEGLSIGRLVAAENLHLTLAFLDDQPEAMLAALDEELLQIHGPVPKLHIAGLDVLGNNKARLLFAVLAPDPALATLRKRIRSAARTVGIGLKRERFRPHITLARFRHNKAPGEMVKLAEFLALEGGFSQPAFTVDEFLLYRSTLTPEGPIYDSLVSYPLRDAPGL